MYKRRSKKSIRTNKSNKTRRAPGKTQISISLPTHLLDKIDQMADTVNRNRSNFISTEMIKIVGDN